MASYTLTRPAISWNEHMNPDEWEFIAFARRQALLRKK